MPSICITGGVATGKSTFSNYVCELLPEAKFFDADHAAHQLVDLVEIRDAIRQEFGTAVFSAGGDLNRSELRAIIFRDAAKKRALEEILHPPIRRQWSAEATTHRNSPDFFFADIPLLYETGGETLCDHVVVVACSPAVQLQRLRDRGMGLQPMSHRQDVDATAEQMIALQMPLEQKIKRADHVVWNNGSTQLLRDQAKLLVDLWQTEQWTKV